MLQREGSTTTITVEPVRNVSGAPLRTLAGSTASDTGAFGSLIPWPLVPIHVALLPDGRLMSFGRDADAASQMFYDIWDPSAGTTESAHLTLPNQTGTDLFCSNQMLLDNGLVLMAGGDVRDGSGDSIGAQGLEGNQDANAFDPRANTLTRIGRLNEPRWYASMTKLTTGEVFIQGGAIDMTLDHGAIQTEIASADGRFYRALSGFTVNDLPWYYPRNFVDASGQIVGWAHNRSYRIDPRGDGIRTDTGIAPGVTLNNASLAVMYAPGKVLIAGGGTTSAVRVDIDSAVPAYEPVPSMGSPRIWGTATVLPDGTVLVSGGSDIDTSVVDAGMGQPALQVAIYDPALNHWTAGPATARARLYHSTAVLLPDASVLLGGGGLPGPITNMNAEIYYPSYLFNEVGEFAQRPIVQVAPGVLDPGATFVIESGNNNPVSRLVLVKGGAVTHGFDMDQRLIPLAFEQAGNKLASALPSISARTPPGFYRLFVFNEQGVPSQGHPIRINAMRNAPEPVFKPINSAARQIGEQSATSLPLTCGPAEQLIGLHGSFESWLTSIGPICQSDRIIRRSVLGPSTPSDWIKQCPSGEFVTSIGGQTTGAGDRMLTMEVNCGAESGTQSDGSVDSDNPSPGAVASCPAPTSPSGLFVNADDAGVRGLTLGCR